MTRRRIAPPALALSLLALAGCSDPTSDPPVEADVTSVDVAADNALDAAGQDDAPVTLDAADDRAPVDRPAPDVLTQDQTTPDVIDVIDVPDVPVAMDVADVPVAMDVADVPVAMDVAPDRPDVIDAAVDAALDRPDVIDVVDAALDRPDVIDVVDAAPDVVDAAVDVPVDVACLATETRCGSPSRCVDTRTSGEHCGGCGRTCAGACSGGVCVRVVELTAGDEHVCARLVDGTLRCWGNDADGQIGDGRSGSLAYAPRPTAVPGLAGVAQVAAGAYHTCARLTDGTLRCWGRNSSGQLGLGAYDGPRTTPVPVPGIGDVTEIAAGGNSTCAVTSDGGLWCWGNNVSGQQGWGTAGGVHNAPLRVPGLPPARSVELSNNHICVLLVDGTARCAGSNPFGQLGIGTTGGSVATFTAVVGLTGAVELRAGTSHTCARLTDGRVRCWGDNGVSELGDTAPGAARPMPGADAMVPPSASLAAGGFFSCAAAASDGSVRCWGQNTSGQVGDDTMSGARSPTLVAGVTGATQVATGATFACALRTDGTVRCWGNDGAGALGDDAAGGGRRVPEPVPDVAGVAQVVAADVHTCVRLTDGTARCFGNNPSYVLGDGSAEQWRFRPVPVAGLAGAVDLAAGAFSTCARLADGTARCWGFNDRGQLGDGTLVSRSTPVTVRGLAGAAMLTGVTALSLAQTTTCALLADRTVRCWGSNAGGTLGLGYTDMFSHEGIGAAVRNLTTPTVLGRGLFHVCAGQSDGAVRCWGNNTQGQLGDGTTTGRYDAVVVTGVRSATQLSGGYSHTCALLADGTVKCWGDNTQGQCGLAPSTTPVTTAVTVAGLADVVEIAAGDFFNCARLADTTVRCWGSNNYGQLGDDSQFVARGTPVTAYGLRDATGIATGMGHACARVSDGTLRCWGVLTALGVGIVRTPRW